MKRKPTQIILTLILLFSAVQCGRGISERYADYLAKHQFVPTFLLIAAILLIGTLFMGFLIWKPGIFSPFRKLKAGLPFLRILPAVLCAVFPAVLYNFLPFCEPYQNLWIRVFISLFFVVLSAWFWETGNETPRFQSLIPAALIFSAGFVLLTQFRDITNYPFSIGWSEGNRMWDYSVLFGKDRYNFPQDQTIPAYIDIGRQSLWGAIFLFKNADIVAMRVWNDFLFTIPCALLGWALMKRNSGKWAQKLAFGLWAMLFLTQGPIYTPLTIAAILVALGSKTPIVLNCLLTAVASFYAVMSRSTWIAAASAFAVFLMFLKQDSEKPAKTRWIHSVALGISGLIGAGIYMKRETLLSLLGLGAQVSETAEDAAAATAAMEAVPPIFTPEWFNYYLNRQPLLWDRLWPNETYAPGIVLGLAAAVLPVLLLILCWHLQKKWQLDRWQKLLLFAGSGIFLVAGLIFSVKIGGGSNLHNLDMFLILVLVIAAIAWNTGMSAWIREKIGSGSAVCFLILAAILIPCWNAMTTTVPKIFPNQATTEDALQKIRGTIAEHPGEDILFMDQRQLLTFHEVEKIPLIADYEKKWMMDEAMANDASYFEPYIKDLKEHRFAAIITEPLHIKFQGAGQNFSEENDLFVTWVSLPTLCYYEPYETFEEQGVQILVPRESVLEQEGVVCP